MLLLHPMHSAWMLYNGEETEEIIQYGMKFEQISQAMSDDHIEHHYGDEEILRKHDEELLQEIDERDRQRADDERRRAYD